MLRLNKVLLTATLLSSLTFHAAALSDGAQPDAGDSSAQTSVQFNVSPTIAAPGQFIEFNWQVKNAAAFSVTPSLLDEYQPSSAF